MTPTELDLVYKSVKTIEAMEDYGNDGYSRTGHSMMRDDGYSYRRGRYSRDTVKELGDMMARAGSDIERQTIAKLMDRFS